MNKKTVNYTEAPPDVSRAIAEGEIVADFLPSPEILRMEEPKVWINGESTQYAMLSVTENY